MCQNSINNIYENLKKKSKMEKKKTSTRGTISKRVGCMCLETSPLSPVS